MIIKLRNIRPLGRYINPETGRAVSVKKGDRPGYGTTHHFYLFRYEKVLISQKDFYDNWKKVI